MINLKRVKRLAAEASEAREVNHNNVMVEQPGTTPDDQLNSAYAGLLLPFYRMRYCYEGASFPEELFREFEEAFNAVADAVRRYDKVLGDQIARINNKKRVSDLKRAETMERSNALRKLWWDVEETYAHLRRYRERGDAPPKAELSPRQWLGVPSKVDRDIKIRLGVAG